MLGNLGIGHFKEKKLSDLPKDQADKYARLLTKMSIELGKSESSILLRDSETLSPLFHIYSLCKEGKAPVSEETMREAESLIAAVFPGPSSKPRAGESKKK